MQRDLHPSEAPSLVDRPPPIVGMLTNGVEPNSINDSQRSPDDPAAATTTYGDAFLFLFLFKPLSLSSTFPSTNSSAGLTTAINGYNCSSGVDQQPQHRWWMEASSGVDLERRKYVSVHIHVFFAYTMTLLNLNVNIRIHMYPNLAYDTDDHLKPEYVTNTQEKHAKDRV